MISHTDLSERLSHSGPGGGTEELDRSGASSVLPSWGAERTALAWMTRRRMLVSCIVTVAGGLRRVLVVERWMLRLTGKENQTVSEKLI